MPLKHTLSSSTVEAAKVSSVTRIASCFPIPLSLSEWASTIAPSHRVGIGIVPIEGIAKPTWEVVIAHKKLSSTWSANTPDAQTNKQTKAESEPTVQYASCFDSAMIKHTTLQHSTQTHSRGCNCMPGCTTGSRNISGISPPLVGELELASHAWGSPRHFFFESPNVDLVRLRG